MTPFLWTAGAFRKILARKQASTCTCDQNDESRRAKTHACYVADTFVRARAVGQRRDERDAPLSDAAEIKTKIESVLGECDFETDVQDLVRFARGEHRRVPVSQAHVQHGHRAQSERRNRSVEHLQRGSYYSDASWK